MKTKNGTKSAAKTPAKSKGRAARPSASASTSAATPPPLPVDDSAARQFKALSASVDNSLARLSDSLKASAGRIADTFTRAGECATESLRLSLSPAIRPARDAALSRFRQLREDTRLSLSPAISRPLSPVAPPARELPTHYLPPEAQRGILNAASPGLGDLAFPFPAGSARAFLYDDLIRRTLFFCEARPIRVFRVAGAGDLRRDGFRWFYEGVKTAVEEWARKMEGKPREAIAADAERVVEQSRPALEKTLVKAKLQRGELTPGGILLHFESWMRAALEAVQGAICGESGSGDADAGNGGRNRPERREWKAGDFRVAKGFENWLKTEKPEWLTGGGKIDARAVKTQNGSGWLFLYPLFEKFCKSFPQDKRFSSVRDRVKDGGDLQALCRELHRRPAVPD